MDLYIFHRILISAAILFDVFFTTFCIRMYNATGDGSQIVWAVVSSVIVIGLVAYLVIFNRKTAKLQKLREAMMGEVNCPSCGYNLRGSTGQVDASFSECPECGHAISSEIREQALAV